MTDKTARESRFRERAKDGFMPDYDSPTDHRQAAALEYAAYFLGKIEKTLGEINVKLAKR